MTRSFQRATNRGMVMVGIGLASAVTVAAMMQRNAARQRPRYRSDSAPRYTARHPSGENEVVGRTVTIGKSRAELYAYWRDFGNLPKFMHNVDRIEPGEEPGSSVWHIHGPLGKTLRIETRVSEEVEGEVIAWKSTENSEVQTSGRVTFSDAPGDRGTRVTLIVAFNPPGGEVGELFAKFVSPRPEMQARHDLKRFKMLMETGEIATSARTKKEADEYIRTQRENA